MIHRLLPLIAVLILASTAFAQNTVILEVDLGKLDMRGDLMVALCPTERAFDSEKECAFQKFEIPENSASPFMATLTDVPAGTFALKAYMDLNGNATLDHNSMGIPTEPFGFSNDAMGMSGPPKFEKAKFTVVEGEQVLQFKLRGG